MELFLSDFADEGRSPRSVSMYRVHLRRLLRFRLERGLGWHEITPDDIRVLRLEMLDEGLAPKSVNTVLGAVNTFYRWGVEAGYFPANPAQVKRVKEPKHVPDFLADDELARVEQALVGLPYRVGLAFRTMLAAGLRVSEAATLTPESLLMVRGVLHLKVLGKGNKQRLAPVLRADVAEALQAVAARTLPGKPLFGVTVTALKSRAYRLKERTGVDFHSHRLRHTFATRALQQGVPLDVLQGWMGHESIETTRRYAATLDQRSVGYAQQLLRGESSESPDRTRR